MLNTSLRRVVARTCSSTPSPVPSLSTTPTIACFTSHAHQRRHSSSKPPVPPNNGSPPIPTAVKQVNTPSSESRQATTESRSSRRRNAKEKLDAKDESEYYNWASSLPSVPSLHLNPKDVYLAAFFGTYRPTSITGPVVPESTMDAVDKIFQPKPKRSRTAPQDVIYTLSSAVENLNDQMTTKKADQKAHIIKALVQANNNVDSNEPHHLDGAPQSINSSLPNVRIALQEIARRFRPYNVPPAPVPLADPHAKSVQHQEAENEMFLDVEVQQAGSEPYVQRVVINGQNSEDPETRDFFTSNGAPTVEVEDPAGFQYIVGPEINQPSVGRRRQGLYRSPTMMAISVKRQRRLKMKKHKFKKLTKRLRTLRQRQGKI
ncbi:uncharacterized protein A1O9_09949 [Exophiala aquamarina CBS 119918]|uniref:Small ribosomal subunit protein mS38 n=1 Tax=Exophiala aquamarina CBS 119918 TaxID=1182545 RepID=A0A072P1Z3_9EURO|nr:uncharacterized protein A1O9_09949 [Exophiala aquamarina CBS 119918]KEF54154.1 hypothetical protein A1O9_09949 [Exophiala aquamarina CBS 119918]